jgi:hypothetical protein
MLLADTKGVRHILKDSLCKNNVYRHTVAKCANVVMKNLFTLFILYTCLLTCYNLCWRANSSDAINLNFNAWRLNFSSDTRLNVMQPLHAQCMLRMACAKISGLRNYVWVWYYTCWNILARKIWVMLFSVISRQTLRLTLTHAAWLVSVEGAIDIALMVYMIISSPHLIFCLYIVE